VVGPIIGVMIPLISYIIRSKGVHGVACLTGGTLQVIQRSFTKIKGMGDPGINALTMHEAEKSDSTF
jgi:hypothetical protein